jgi:Right handed beta helix region/Protein of unknown function (DUF1565)
MSLRYTLHSLLVSFLMIIATASTVTGQEWHVATTGSDSAAGNAAKPFATIGKAASVARAGDTVLIASGTYRPADRIVPAASGTATAPITYRRSGTGEVLIDAQGRLPAWDWDGVIDLWEKEWLVIDGLTIANSRWFGIGIRKGGHHIIRNCTFRDTKSSGVYAAGAVGIIVADCDIRRACLNTDWSRGSQECITMADVDGFEIARNRVGERLQDYGPGGEGIDAKGNSRNGSIHHNVCYDNARLGIYVDAYGGKAENIDVYANTVINCRSGIVIANEVNAGWTRGVRVRDNIVRDCSSPGIRIAGYAGNGPVQDVDVYHNTIVRCGLATKGWESCGILIEADNSLCRSFRVSNNLVSGNYTQIRSQNQSWLILDRNLIWGATVHRGTNPIESDPRFIDGVSSDFRLSTGSPAIDSALGSLVSTSDHAGNSRSQDGDADGRAIADLGALERPLAMLPLAARDIGSSKPAGSARESNGVWTVQGGGADIWGSGDQFHFASQSMTGDGTIIARVTGFTAGHIWAKAGLMMRESTAAGARHAFVCVTKANGVAFQRRLIANGDSLHTSGSNSSAPRWLKLVRQGSVVTGYESADGVVWTAVGSATIQFGATIEVGLAVTSHDVAVLATATFANVQVMPASRI